MERIIHVVGFRQQTPETRVTIFLIGNLVEPLAACTMRVLRESVRLVGSERMTSSPINSFCLNLTVALARMGVPSWANMVKWMSTLSTTAVNKVDLSPHEIHPGRVGVWHHDIALPCAAQG